MVPERSRGLGLRSRHPKTQLRQAQRLPKAARDMHPTVFLFCLFFPSTSYVGLCGFQYGGTGSSSYSQVARPQSLHAFPRANRKHLTWNNRHRSNRAGRSS
jgi:hypothetical protein